MGAIYICRHGQTDMNVRGCLQGRTDTRLNETGRDQARGAAAFLAEHGILIDEVFTSPLSRAVESAEIISGLSRDQFTLEHLLIEMSFGDWEGLVPSSIPPEEFAAFHENSDLHPAPGGETATQVMDRGRKLIGMLKSRRPDRHENILLSTHGAFLHGLICCVRGWPPEKFWDILIGNCEIFRLDLDGNDLIPVFKGYMGASKVG